MDEFQYGQAIAEYKAAIEIEPNNAKAYHALVKLYVQTGDYKAAVKVLDHGIEQTGSKELSEYLDIEYNGDGKPVKEIHYDANGTLSSYWIYEYDGNGNCVKKTCYNANGVIVR